MANEEYQNETHKYDRHVVFLFTSEKFKGSMYRVGNLKVKQAVQNQKGSHYPVNNFIIS